MRKPRVRINKEHLAELFSPSVVELGLDFNSFSSKVVPLRIWRYNESKEMMKMKVEVH